MSIKSRLDRAENSNQKRTGKDGRIIRQEDGTICYGGPDDAEWDYRVLWVWRANAPAHVREAYDAGTYTPSWEQLAELDYSMSDSMPYEDISGGYCYVIDGRRFPRDPALVYPYWTAEKHNEIWQAYIEAAPDYIVEAIAAGEYWPKEIEQETKDYPPPGMYKYLISIESTKDGWRVKERHPRK